MTSDKQSNVRRTPVESKSNRSCCNHRINLGRTDIGYRHRLHRVIKFTRRETFCSPIINRAVRPLEAILRVLLALYRSVHSVTSHKRRLIIYLCRMLQVVSRACNWVSSTVIVLRRI